MSWKSLLYFTRTERLGIGLLIGGILVTVAFCLYVPSQEMEWTPADEQFAREYEAFIASLDSAESSERGKEYPSSYSRGLTLYSRGLTFHSRGLTPTAFDPNLLDSAGFVALGLPPWMARNILRYRAKGGVFHRAEDFRKIYGLTAEQFTTLHPYIRIADEFAASKNLPADEPLPGDSLSPQQIPGEPFPATERIEKYPAGAVVDLNKADTTELKKIPGIGSYTAQLIVNYRRKLGGFYAVEQLGDLRLPVDKFQGWFTVAAGQTHPLNLNQAGIERLNAHPYIDFYQAKVIVEYRRKKGKLRSLQQLKLYEEFTPEDFKRIQPYVCF